jgi:hypothetical protein
MVERLCHIERLEPAARQVVDEMIVERRWTIDEIVAALREVAGEATPSRAAVGNYVKRMRERAGEPRPTLERRLDSVIAHLDAIGATLDELSRAIGEGNPPARPITRDRTL